MKRVHTAGTRLRNHADYLDEEAFEKEQAADAMPEGSAAQAFTRTAAAMTRFGAALSRALADFLTR